MYYTDSKGEPAVGELWSPGPKMHTVWVLTAGEPIVVDTRTMTEMRYLAPELGVPHSKSAVDAARKVIEACPASGYPRTLTPRDAAEAEAVGHARTVIDEYVAVSHAFFGGDEPGFVNGVLDRLAKRKRAAEFGLPVPEGELDF